MVEILRHTGGADGAALLRRDGREDLSSTIDAVVCPGSTSAKLVASLQREDATPEVAWHPRNPPRRAIDRFVATSPATVSCGAFLGAQSIPSIAAAMLYDGARFLGEIVLWSARRDAFRRRELSALNERVHAAIALLAEATSIEDRELAGPTALVVRGDGDVELASPAASAWVARTNRAQLVTDAVAECEARDEPAATRVIDGAMASLVRLDGRGAPWLVTLTALTPITLMAEASLSERQRAVAHSAAAGATAAEIARDLGISEETVRDHLKAVYRRLGVASRLELSQRLGR